MKSLGCALTIIIGALLLAAWVWAETGGAL